MHKVQSIFENKILLSLAVLASVLMILVLKPAKADAYVNNPAVPANVQASLESACPANDSAPGQTIGITYFNPEGISSTDRSGGTGMYATAAMCTNNNYNQVRDISIFVTSVTRYAGNANITFTGGNGFSLMNIPVNDFQHASGPAGKIAGFTNLSDGWNCWTIGFDMSAKYGTSTSNLPGTGSSNLCVYFTLQTDSGTCSVTSYPSSVVAGSSFPATFRVSNTGNTAWPTGGYPFVSNYAYRYRLGSASPDNTTRWGTTRLELPGVITNFGPVFSPGTTYSGLTYSFTAPTTPGIYNFSWRILQENTAGKNNIGSCSRTITVTSPVATNATVQVLKMDDSGVSATGSSEAWPSFGGDCYSETYALSCGNGSLQNYPFSDDCIRIDGGSCATENPVINSTLTPGNHTITVTTNGTNNSPWTLRGFSICGNNVSGCNSIYLTQTSNITNSSSGTMTFNFQSGVYYYLRWIYTNVGAATTCSPTAVSLGINDPPYEFTAGGGSGSFVWTSTPAATTAIINGNKYSVSYNSEGTKVITVTSNGQSANCTVTVSRKPYFRAYGGDVSATGLGFANACVSSGASNIIAYNQGSAGAGGAFAGAGSQLAVFASGQVSEFASVFARSAVPLAAKGLMFANEQAGDYGGNWSGGDCMPDFYSKAKPTDTINTGPYVIPPQTFGVGSKITIYVNGDAYIENDIRYPSGLGPAPNGLYTADNMYSFRLIVRGNIYVGANVTQLDGIYIAQPINASTGGKFYTCAFRTGLSFRPPSVVGTSSPEMLDTVNGCNRKLTVYGAVAAKAVKLLRTNGSVQSAASSETYTNANQAETFIYSPEVWLGLQGGQSDDDAIGGLAPIL